MARFIFHGLDGPENVWQALERVSDPDALLEMAIARLRAETPNVVRYGLQIIVAEDDVEDVAARARELVRIFSAEPYFVNGKPTFLPFYFERTYLAVLRWKGSLASSRLEQYSDPTTFEGVVEVRADGYSLYIEAVTTDPDVVILLGGVPLTHPIRITVPHLLFLTRRSDPTREEQIVLFPNQPHVVFFASSGLLGSVLEVTAQDPWTLTALEAAKLRGHPFSLMLVDRAAGERRDTVTALPSNVRRTVGYSADVLAIAAEGSEDELIVHGDQMREHFASPAVTIAEAIAKPTETPHALYQRVSAMLGR